MGSNEIRTCAAGPSGGKPFLSPLHHHVPLSTAFFSSLLVIFSFNFFGGTSRYLDHLGFKKSLRLEVIFSGVSTIKRMVVIL